MPIKDLDLDLLPTLKKVDIRAKRRVLSRVLEGSWTAMMKGRGMEFAGFRQYTFGDDASRIDWGATLRSKETLIREFEEFKNVTVFMLLDVSETMLFSSVGKLKAEYGAELLFNFSAAILDNGDSVGFAMFNDDVVAKIQPGMGKDVLYRMANELQKPKNYGGGFSLKPAIRLLENFLHARALVILISDFIGMEKGWERYIKMIGQKHDLIAITLRDPRDREMPALPAQVLVEDPLTHEKLYIDAKQYRKLYNESVKKEEIYLKSVFEKAKAGNIFMTTDSDTMVPLLSYFRKRSAILKG
ncbi:DUF58 domain-containing protein [Candidatus Woesearchaeota archaeon]|nr:DUF58 domain-containing protein [Candidatus Woesearchaeota archaeon]